VKEKRQVYRLGRFIRHLWTWLFMVRKGERTENIPVRGVLYHHRRGCRFFCFLCDDTEVVSSMMSMNMGAWLNFFKIRIENFFMTYVCVLSFF